MIKNGFLDRLSAGETMVADGATGTNLFIRGLPHGTPSESWVLEKPEEVIRLHRDFSAAGAQILLTCTFGANPLRLAEFGLADRTGEINRRAVDLVKQAVGDNPVLIAGSIGPLGKLLQPYGPVSKEEAMLAYSEHSKSLSEAGVDLILIETQFDLDEATTAVSAARKTSNLPVVISFSYDRGTRTMMGVNPTRMASVMNGLGVDMLGINCGRSLDDNLRALEELRQASNLPIWFKPNAGLPHVDGAGNSSYDTSAQEMGDQVSQWLANGASVIGGCCGTTPEHLAAIAVAAHAYLPSM